MSRRLPVYLLLDTSGSMEGEALEAVKNGMDLLLSCLRQDPQALETAYLSVITFDASARQIVPLTDLDSFQMPSISATGCTELGQAFKVLADCISREVLIGSKDVKGDWKPIVFLMTDGEPTDNWQAGLTYLKQNHKLGLTVACGAGPSVNVNTLKTITECVVLLDTADENTIKAFFKWVSSTISVGTQKADAGYIPGEVIGLGDLPPPPPSVTLVL